MPRLISWSLLLVPLLALCLSAVGDYAANSEREIISSLLRTMLYSVEANAPYPNPSVHIALRLARDHNLPKEDLLLNELKEAAVRKVTNGEDFSSGMVALYTLALIASCNNPTSVTVSGTTINLLKKLEEKLTEEIDHIKNKTFPLTNYYQVSLDVLTVCVSKKSEISECSIRTLVDAVEQNKFTYGSRFSVDTGAVAALALRCVKDKEQKLDTMNIENALKKVLTQILEHVEDDGIIGNLYSTGLAIQAFSVNSDLIPPGSWDLKKSRMKLLEEVERGSFSNPQSASQIAPSLDGKTYLDVNKLNCSADLDNLTLPEISSTPPPVTQPVDILVEYSIVDGLNQTFSDKVNVIVPRGSLLIRVLEEAQKMHPERFRFNVTMTLWGPSLTSIRGLTASSENKTYWQLLSGSTPLDQGIGDYRPQNGEHIFAKFSNY
ncbi:cobalamin binding intrinsic factor-like [Heterodontus francisci]|uniref:cobalamin binding intrinsic factor-like n=1 Tax=Heterodontus francisci TaxID=7792 RepID=UPI00355B1C7A